MKIVYIAGFFAPVEKKLRAEIPGLLDNKSVVWIPQFANGDPDLRTFKARLLSDVAQGATEVCLCLFLFRGREYLNEVFRSILAEALERAPDLNFEIVPFKNAQDAAGVLAYVRHSNPTRTSKRSPTLENLERWIAENYSSRLLLHPRALRGIKLSRFVDVPLIFDCMALLGGPYWAMRQKGAEPSARQSFEAAMLTLGLDLTPSISDTEAGKFGKTYYVQYPLSSSRERLLESHLRKGSDRDQRNCLRIYFFWDAEASRVVIGWLPSHLENART